jgi:hypothetical protein
MGFKIHEVNLMLSDVNTNFMKYCLKAQNSETECVICVCIVGNSKPWLMFMMIGIFQVALFLLNVLFDHAYSEITNYMSTNIAKVTLNL